MHASTQTAIGRRSKRNIYKYMKATQSAAKIKRCANEETRGAGRKGGSEREEREKTEGEMEPRESNRKLLSKQSDGLQPGRSDAEEFQAEGRQGGKVPGGGGGGEEGGARLRFAVRIGERNSEQHLHG